MKIRIFTQFLLAALIAVSVGTGCKHGIKSQTPLPGTNPKPPGPGGESTTTEPVKPTPGVPNETSEKGTQVTKEQHETSDIDLDKFNQDRDVFKANTVYFEFDKSTVKTGERSKIEEVANYLKGTAQNKLLIEGYCDERGTEEYNRALGEKRALALREYLAKLGIKPNRVLTRSYGEDKPASAGHDEAAWAKNRRGEFVLLKPKPGTE